MENYITDEKTGIEYKFVGDYYLPMLKAPDVPEIGMWGRRYLSYLRQNKRAIHDALLLSEKLFEHAKEIDQTAEEMYGRLVNEMARSEEINEKLKASDQMAWVRAMNNISARVEEIILKEFFRV